MAPKTDGRWNSAASLLAPRAAPKMHPRYKVDLSLILDGFKMDFSLILDGFRMDFE